MLYIQHYSNINRYKSGITDELPEDDALRHGNRLDFF